jgi:hypothetical protein
VPPTLFTEQYLTGVRDQALAGITDAVVGSGLSPQQIAAGLPAEFDRQAVHSAGQLAAQYQVDRYFAGLDPAPGGTQAPGGTPMPPAAIRDAVAQEVRLQVQRGIDAVLGTAVLPTTPGAPVTTHLPTVANVIRQATEDLPARVGALAAQLGVPVPAVPAVSSGHPPVTGVVSQPVDHVSQPVTVPTPLPGTEAFERHATQVVDAARTQFIALAQQQAVDPAGHGQLAAAFQRDLLDAYRATFAPGAGTPQPGGPLPTVREFVPQARPDLPVPPDASPIEQSLAPGSWAVPAPPSPLHQPGDQPSTISGTGAAASVSVLAPGPDGTWLVDVAVLRDGVPARVVRGTPFDVRETATDQTGMPAVVRDSYKAAGLDTAPPDRPRIGLENVEGVIAYDHRVLDAGDGVRIQDFELRLHLNPLDPAAALAAEGIAADTVADHDTRLNQGFRVDGDLVHFVLRFVDDPAEAHATVDLTSRPISTASQGLWSTHSQANLRFQEVAQFYGLRDENGRRLLGPVYRDDSVLGPSPANVDLPGENVYQRHLDSIAATAANVSLTVPDANVAAAVAAAHFAAAVDTIPPVVGTDVNAVCLTLMQGLAAELYPTGIRRPPPVDDADLGTGHVFPAVPDREFVLVDSWTDLRARLVQAGPGAVAFVLMGAPGEVGHAVAARFDGIAMTYADLRRPVGERLTSTVDGLPSDVDLRVLLVDPHGFTMPTTPVAESASTARALVDARSTDATGTRYAMLGIEKEIPVEIIDPNSGEILPYRQEIGRGHGFKIEIDHQSKGPRTVAVAEFVTEKMAFMPGETGYGPTQVRAAMNRATRRLANVPDGQVVALRDVLRPQDGITLNGLGNRLVVSGGVFANDYTQWTAGIPPFALHPMLRYVANNTRPGANPAPRNLLLDGLEVGSQIRQEFEMFTRGRALEVDRRALQGVVSLLYPHIAATLARSVLQQQTGMNLVEKNFLLAASRVDFRGIRNALSPDVRGFLAQNGPRIRAIFNARADLANQGQAAVNAGMLDFVDGSVNLFQSQFHNNLMNTFLYGDQLPNGEPIAEVTMDDIGIYTNYAAIDTHPFDMIPVEMRYLTGSTGQPPIVDETSDDIMDMLRPYAEFRMPAQNAADLNANNATVIGESVGANAALDNALRYPPATYEQAHADAAAAARNVATTEINLRYAETAYAAIRATFGPTSPYAIDARHNLDAARQAHITALDLLHQANTQANTQAQPPQPYYPPPPPQP